MSDVSDATPAPRDGRSLTDRDLASLTTFLRHRLATGSSSALRLVSEHRGQRNINAIVSDGNHEWVVRYRIDDSPRWLSIALKEAYLPLEEEYRVLRALDQSSIPVAAPVAVCTDLDVIGRPFLITMKVEGEIVRDRDDAARLTAAGARRCSEELIDILATLHRAPPRLVASHALQPATAITERLQRSSKFRHSGPRTELSELFAELEDRVRAQLPIPQRRSIVHGDYRLDNAILSAEVPGAVAAVIDWEKVRVDDPLVELARFLCLWNHPATTPFVSISGVPRPELGFLDRDTLLTRYASQTSLDVSSFHIYEMTQLHELALFVALFAPSQTDAGSSGRRPGRSEHIVRTALELADRT